jgi:hypothetical protein
VRCSPRPDTRAGWRADERPCATAVDITKADIRSSSQDRNGRARAGNVSVSDRNIKLSDSGASTSRVAFVTRPATKTLRPR